MSPLLETPRVFVVWALCSALGVTVACSDSATRVSPNPSASPSPEVIPTPDATPTMAPSDGGIPDGGDLPDGGDVSDGGIPDAGPDENRPPQAVDDSFEAELGSTLEVPAAAGVLANDSDPDGDALVAFLVEDVPRGRLTLRRDGALSYTPASDDLPGELSFRYRAHDGRADSMSATVTLRVSRPNPPPVGLPEVYEILEDEALRVSAPGVLRNDSDPEEQPLQAEIAEAPEHGELTLEPDGGFLYAPQTDFWGEDRFRYFASDGDKRSAAVDVFIRVRPVNDPPRAISETVMAEEDLPLTLTLRGEDPDGDSLSFLLVGQPEHGRVTGARPEITYTPPPDFDGEDSISFRVYDGEVSGEVGVVTVVVAPVNDAPVAEGFSTTAVVNTPQPIPLRASDVDRDPLIFNVTRPAGVGQVSIDGGVATYTPAQGYVGEDSFAYEAFDGVARSEAVEVVVRVAPAGGCDAVLRAGIGEVDGVYAVDPDGVGGEPAFEVFCDMQSEGGGWIRIELEDDGVWIAENAVSNPWAKCETDGARHYAHIESGIGVTPDSSAGSHTYDVPLVYLNPATDAPFTEGQLSALRGHISELAASTRMVATEADSDNAGDIAGPGAGHDVVIEGSDGETLHLTPGRNGDCGGGTGSYPRVGSATGYWLWHSSAELSIVDGDVGTTTSADLPGLPQTHLLPTRLELRIYTGGGASFGWEQDFLLVR